MMLRNKSVQLQQTVHIVSIAIIALMLFDCASVAMSSLPTDHRQSVQQDHHLTCGIRARPENILTPEGEVTIDRATGRRLPEELNDGELEGGDHHIEWSHATQHRWALEYPQCMGPKMRQSPINIITDKVKLKPDMRLEFVDYNQEVKFRWKNTHHSISATPIPSVFSPTVKLSWLPEGGNAFELQEIHFHWGDGAGSMGSEHRINNAKAAAEMHMVHYKRGVKKQDIGIVDDSLLVIGVLIESDFAKHPKLEAIMSSAVHINGTDNEHTEENPENLINLLPDHHSSFYVYDGSLTTPPCYEVVTWVIMSEPLYMNHEMLMGLSNIEATCHNRRKKITSNNRDVQPLFGRPVFVSFNVSESNSAGAEQPDAQQQMQAPLQTSVQQVDTFRQFMKDSEHKLSRQVDDASDRLSARVTQLEHELNIGLRGVHDVIDKRHLAAQTVLSNGLNEIHNELDRRHSDLESMLSNRFTDLNDTLDRRHSTMQSMLINRFNDLHDKIAQRHSMVQSMLTNGFKDVQDKLNQRQASAQEQFSKLMDEIEVTNQTVGSVKNDLKSMANILESLQKKLLASRRR